MSRRFDSIFEDEDDKAYMVFEFRNNGKCVTLNNKYPYDVTWDEILGDVIRCLEGEFGYTFKLHDGLGVWAGRNKDD